MFRITPYRNHYNNVPKVNYADMIKQVDAELLPLGCVKEELGLSQDGNFMLYGYGWGDFSKPTMWLDSNIHGSEWWTVYFTKEFMVRVLSANFYDKKAVELLRDTFSFYYIPSVNPWGFENNKYNNVNQVNLNRNFDNNWETYIGDNQPGIGNNYKGTSVFSEAEAKVIRDKFLEIKPYLAINTHTSGGNNGSGIDTQKRFKWYNTLMTDVFKSSKLSIKETEAMEWAGQFNPQAPSWYGLQTSKEGKRTISTVFEHQSNTNLFNYGLTTLFILTFTVLHYYKTGKMKLNSLAELKQS